MRVLYLTHRVPYAPNRGDRIRAYHTLRHLRAAGVKVHLVALAHDADEQTRGSLLDDVVSSHDIVRVPWPGNVARAALALAGERPLTHVMLDSPEMARVLAGCRDTFAPDVVLAFCSGMARFALEPPLAELPLVLDLVDVDSEKWRALGRVGSPVMRPIYRREARLLAAFEARAALAASHTLVVNEREQRTLHALAPSAAVSVMPNGIDLEFFRPPADAARRARVVFVGVFDYEPNASGARWLLRHVWHDVRARRPDAELLLVGSGPPAWLRREGHSVRGVTVTGAVNDVRPFLWESTVSVAPLAVSRGLQNKVLEALAAGLRVVTTSVVASGLPPSLRDACVIADTPGAFAASVLECLDGGPSPLDAHALTPHAWPSALGSLVPILMRSAPAGGGTGAHATRS